MSKAIWALWAAIIGTAGSLFMAGWTAHAGLWWLFTSTCLTGIAGMICLGFMAWMFVLD